MVLFQYLPVLLTGYACCIDNSLQFAVSAATLFKTQPHLISFDQFNELPDNRRNILSNNVDSNQEAKEETVRKVNIERPIFRKYWVVRNVQQYN